MGYGQEEVHPKIMGLITRNWSHVLNYLLITLHSALNSTEKLM